MNSQIKLNNFKKYLEMNGWTIESPVGSFVKIKKQYDELINLLIPNTEELLDYESRLKDIIGTVANLEEKEFKELFEEIRNVGYDLMKIRFVANKTKQGTIPLNDFIGAMNNVKKMITFGACSEIQEKRKVVETVNLNTCDFKGCKNNWTHRVCIMDMCDFHYNLWIKNGGQKN